jgi:hypothetical protein
VPDISDPHVTVEEILDVPAVPGSERLVPFLVITVTYQASFYETERKLPSISYGFWEQIDAIGVVTLGREYLDVTPGSGTQVIPREKTFYVEKRHFTRAFGLIGPIPIQCRITISIDVDRVSREALTNEVKLAGLSVDSSVAEAPTVLTRVLSWVERLITRREP